VLHDLGGWLVGYSASKLVSLPTSYTILRNVTIHIPSKTFHYQGK